MAMLLMMVLMMIGGRDGSRREDWQSRIIIAQVRSSGFQVFRLACRSSGVQVFRFSGWHMGVRFSDLHVGLQGFMVFRLACRRCSGFQVSVQVFKISGSQISLDKQTQEALKDIR